MRLIKKYFLLLNFLCFGCVFLFSGTAFSQEVYEHISNKSIYAFLDELANQHIITLNSVVKPYAKNFIALKLKEADGKKNELSKRQQAELAFYLKDYTLELNMPLTLNKKTNVFSKNPLLGTSLNPIGLFYKDSLFTFSAKPILGMQYFIKGEEYIYHRWGGADVYAYAGNHWGFYANLRDNHETQLLEIDSFFTQRMGANYKLTYGGGADYSEMRGGVTYSWKWGSIGLIKDHFVWGDNYNGSNIFSGKTPSFAQITLHLTPAKWFDFHYVHGWLVSEVLDSSRTYHYNNGTREVFRDKYIAANMFTFIPWKNLNISIGNSIVYSDVNVQPAYLIPFFFYKSVDHTLNSISNYRGQNAQMFFNISTRQIKNLHVYTSIFIDEIAIRNIFKTNKHSNFVSGKVGFNLSNYPLKNIISTVEYTRSNPMVYQHFIPTTTFASNLYNLGHYLRDNSQEYFFSIQWNVMRGLHTKFSYTLAQHGNDYVYGTDNSFGIPFMKNKTWQNQTFITSLSYEFSGNSYLFAEYQYGNATGNVHKFTPEFYYGETNTFSIGANIGF